MITRPRVLLADDHKIVAQALASYLREECNLVGVVENGVQLLDAARALQPDVIVSDISMPVLSGVEALRQLRLEGLPCKVIFLTMHCEPSLVSQALQAGADGYVAKNAAGEELITAIREVMLGRAYVSPQIAGEVVVSMTDQSRRQGRTLTPRQCDVLRLISSGLNVKQIAARLDLSPRTVETHKYEMMHNLGVQSVAGLVHYAIRSGLVAC
ncbi:MAG TPA: response regulator transcription factor [Humisphaera sp.]|jgi:DNA-binding NarL/FixJ family response regulator|nr:response regulator transcription factor [Humisphaera sp.]